jgi:hypothetical protein
VLRVATVCLPAAVPLLLPGKSTQSSMVLHEVGLRVGDCVDVNGLSDTCQRHPAAR